MSGCKIATVADSISGLSVSGVTIKDIDTIPAEATVRDVFLFPKPDGFVTNLRVSRETLGRASTSSFNVAYTLTYVLCTGNLGTGRAGKLDFYADIVNKIVLVINAVTNAEALSGSINVNVSGVSSFGKVFDPSGNEHPGTEISFEVLEYYEV